MAATGSRIRHAAPARVRPTTEFAAVLVLLIAVGSAAAIVRHSAKPDRLLRNTSAPTLGRLLDVRSDGDFGDPFILAAPAGAGARPRYVVFATANWEQRVPTAVSDDLKTWVDGPDALPSLPAWALPDPGLRNAWGPAVVVLNDRYVMYYTTKTRAGVECISVATSGTALGPYVDRSDRPLVCQPELGGSIDPSPVRLPDGSMRLVWKSQGSVIARHSTGIWSQPLGSDGLRVLPGRVELIGPTLSWEHDVVEGPSMTQLDGRWWLFFSANSYRGGRYATGVAACASPAGPCAAAPKPFLASSPVLRGPGGLEVFRDLAGQPWVVFHTWRLPGEGNPYEREIHVAPLR